MSIRQSSTFQFRVRREWNGERTKVCLSAGREVLNAFNRRFMPFTLRKRRRRQGVACLSKYCWHRGYTRDGHWRSRLPVTPTAHWCDDTSSRSSSFFRSSLGLNLCYACEYVCVYETGSSWIRVGFSNDLYTIYVYTYLSLSFSLAMKERALERKEFDWGLKKNYGD